MNMTTSHYNRALSFLQQYYFTMDFIIGDSNEDSLSKVITISYVTCRIKHKNYFILCQKKEN